MTQQQMDSPRTVPACPAGHVARYIVDGRRLEARGGHFIECRCSKTAKHPSFDLALAYWLKQHGLRAPETATVATESNVLQLGLRLTGGQSR